MFIPGWSVEFIYAYFFFTWILATNTGGLKFKESNFQVTAAQA
jgi:hypothetical protein